MKLYLAGPVTGTTDFNQRFYEAREALRAAGYEVVCPVEGCSPEEQVEKPWHYWMRRDLRLLLDCEGVALMRGWDASVGATLEYDVATRLRMPVFAVEEWLGRHSAEQLTMIEGD